MNEFEVKEIIKAFAYGYSPERVAEECDITIAQATELQQKYSADIEKKRSEGNE